MSPETSEFADRMYEVLVEEIRTRRPELLDEGFTVAEIYQDLVPYRTHRDRMGIEMNGDYEHALVRLLAGEGDYLEIESDAARRRLREELDSVHPDTGLYRDFAACEVRLNEERLPEGAEEDRSESEESPSDSDLPWDESGAEEEAEDVAAGELAGEADGTEDAPAGLPVDFGEPGPEGDGAADDAVDVEAVEVEDPAEEADPDAVCRWCRAELPEREDLSYCPFCGSRVDLVPCPECGTELEDDWLFCVACGTDVGG